MILQRAEKTLYEDHGVDAIVSNEVIDYLADLADGDGMFVVYGINGSEECVEYV